ncbi:hypothetical protein PR048_029729 [Dryococelus australis]|uniref:Uncharacterized protein n=1 Tax=Dryococelus australis TaxID=614101 RepID=A0ABQ9GGF0_9NEOP|nr:hypothetical protein PR048_029729 [Dryococelus australis]
MRVCVQALVLLGLTLVVMATAQEETKSEPVISPDASVAIHLPVVPIPVMSQAPSHAEVAEISSGPVRYGNALSRRRQPMAIDKLLLGAYSIQKAFSYRIGPLRIWKHGHGSCVTRVQTVNTYQKVVQPISTQLLQTTCRASSHLLMAVWVQHHPNFQTQDGIQMIDHVCICEIPFEDSDMRELVLKCKIHRHTHTCKMNNEYSARWFNFSPKECTETRLIASDTNDGRGANPLPSDYKSATLPLSYEGRAVFEISTYYIYLTGVYKYVVCALEFSSVAADCKTRPYSGTYVRLSVLDKKARNNEQLTATSDQECQGHLTRLCNAVCQRDMLIHLIERPIREWISDRYAAVRWRPAHLSDTKTQMHSLIGRARLWERVLCLIGHCWLPIGWAAGYRVGHQMLIGEHVAGQGRYLGGQCVQSQFASVLSIALYLYVTLRRGTNQTAVYVSTCSFARGERARPCRWSAGFLRFPRPHVPAVLHTHLASSALMTSDVKSRPNLSKHFTERSYDDQCACSRVPSENTTSLTRTIFQRKRAKLLLTGNERYYGGKVRGEVGSGVSRLEHCRGCTVYWELTWVLLYYYIHPAWEAVSREHPLSGPATTSSTNVRQVRSIAVMRGWGKLEIPTKPADQRHRPARFPNGKILVRPRRESKRPENSANSFSNKLDSTIVCVLEPQLVVHWLILRFYPDQVARDTVLVYFPEVNQVSIDIYIFEAWPANSFGNKLDSTIVCVLEPQLVVHWLILRFNPRPGSTGYGPCLLPGSQSSEYIYMSEAWPANSFGNKLDSTIVCVLEPQLVVHWLILRFYPDQVARDKVLVYFPEVNEYIYMSEAWPANSFGNKLDSTIVCVLEPQLAVHWLILRFNPRPSSTGYGPCLLSGSQLVFIGSFSGLTPDQVARDMVLVYFPEVNLAANSFGNKLDSTIVCVLEPQLVVHWLILRFNPRPGSTGYGPCLLSGSQVARDMVLVYFRKSSEYIYILFEAWPANSFGNKLDSTIVCVLEPQLVVHWLILRFNPRPGSTGYGPCLLSGSQVSIYNMFEAWPANSFGNKLDSTIVCVLEPQLVVHWLILGLTPDQVARDMVLVYFPEVNLAANSFGNKLDSTIVCVLEPQLVVHWLILWFNPRPGSTGYGPCLLPGSQPGAANSFGNKLDSTIVCVLEPQLVVHCSFSGFNPDQVARDRSLFTSGSQVSIYIMFEAWPANSFGNKLDSTIVCVLEPQLVVHWLILRFNPRPVARDMVLVYFPEVNLPANSFGNKLDSTIVCVLEPQLVVHWLILRFNPRPGSTDRSLFTFRKSTWPANSFGNKLDSTIVCVLEPQLVVHWLILGFNPRPGSTDTVLVYFPEVNYMFIGSFSGLNPRPGSTDTVLVYFRKSTWPSNSFGNKLDSTIVCVLEPQLAVHWLILRFNPRPGSKGYGPCFTFRSQLVVHWLILWFNPRPGSTGYVLVYFPEVNLPANSFGNKLDSTIVCVLEPQLVVHCSFSGLTPDQVARDTVLVYFPEVNLTPDQVARDRSLFTFRNSSEYNIMFEAWPANSFGNKLDSTIVCVLEPQLVVHWLILRFNPRPGSTGYGPCLLSGSQLAVHWLILRFNPRPGSTGYGPCLLSGSQPGPRNSFGNKLDSTIVCVLEPQLAVHWLILRFKPQTRYTGYGPCLLSGSQLVFIGSFSGLTPDQVARDMVLVYFPEVNLAREFIRQQARLHNSLCTRASVSIHWLILRLTPDQVARDMVLVYFPEVNEYIYMFEAWPANSFGNKLDSTIVCVLEPQLVVHFSFSGLTPDQVARDMDLVYFPEVNLAREFIGNKLDSTIVCVLEPQLVVHFLILRFNPRPGSTGYGPCLLPGSQFIGSFSGLTPDQVARDMVLVYFPEVNLDREFIRQQARLHNSLCTRASVSSSLAHSPFNPDQVARDIGPCLLPEVNLAREFIRNKLDSTIVCVLEPQLAVHWLILRFNPRPGSTGYGPCLLPGSQVDAEVMKVYVILFVIYVAAVAFCQVQDQPASQPAPMPVPRPPPAQPVPTWRFKRRPPAASAASAYLEVQEETSRRQRSQCLPGGSRGDLPPPAQPVPTWRFKRRPPAASAASAYLEVQEETSRRRRRQGRSRSHSPGALGIPYPLHSTAQYGVEYSLSATQHCSVRSRVFLISYTALLSTDTAQYGVEYSLSATQHCSVRSRVFLIRYTALLSTDTAQYGVEYSLSATQHCSVWSRVFLIRYTALLSTDTAQYGVEYSLSATQHCSVRSRVFLIRYTALLSTDTAQYGVEYSLSPTQHCSVRSRVFLIRYTALLSTDTAQYGVEYSLSATQHCSVRSRVHNTGLLTQLPSVTTVNNNVDGIQRCSVFAVPSHFSNLTFEKPPT